MRAQLSQTAQLILWVAVILIVLPLSYNLYQTISRSDDEMCRLSVLQHSKIKDLANPLVNTEIECNRKTIKFFDDHVEINGKLEPVKVMAKTQAKFDNLDSKIIDQVLADEMYHCWRKMGAGDMDVFAADIEGISNNVCLICAQVEFDIGQDHTYTDLNKYLGQNLIHQEEDKGMTYEAYLNKSWPTYWHIAGILLPWTQSMAQTESSLQLQDIDTTKTYSVYFMGFKPSLIDAAIKAYDNQYYLFVSEVGKIPDTCDYIYN